jgi:transcription-repair coupling factor (superfamily II helicase)
VGRSDKQAYAYFFYEGKDLNSKISEEDETITIDGKILKIKRQKYIKRLKAILENSELGSGFKIASNDLEIRGAGNLLGKQQHGNIKYMGYGLYMQLLSEEIEKMKNFLELNNENFS